MGMSVRVGSGKSTGLGDILLLTPVCRQLKARGDRVTVELLPECERFRVLFAGLADEIVITEAPVDLVNEGEDHYARAKLRGLGLDVNDYLPEVREFPSGPAMPGVLFCRDPSQRWRTLRGIGDDAFKAIISRMGTSVLIPVPGLPLRLVMRQFAIRPRYLGVDTGLHHLMLATGGKCIVLHPDDCPDYQYRRWHYDCPARVKYVNFRDMEKVDGDFCRSFFG